MSMVTRRTKNATWFTLLIVYCLALITMNMDNIAYADGLTSRFDQLSDSRISVNATHLVGFDYTNNSTAVGSVVVEFCSNSPIYGLPCTVPAGIDVTSAVLSSQTGFGGFNISAADTTTNKLVINRAVSANPPAGASTYKFDNVLNPNANGTYFVRFSTHGSTNGSGPAIEYGGVVIYLASPLSVSSEVPPYLRFCVAVSIAGFDCSSATTFSLDFGEFSVASAKSGVSEAVVSTNAGLGYSVTLSGTTLTSGSNTISELNFPTPSIPGTSQFGLNLRANSSPSVGADAVGSGTGNASANYSIPNNFKFTSGDIIFSSASTSDFKKFTVSYITNISNSQAAGEYATTITYICLANF